MRQTKPLDSDGCFLPPQRGYVIIGVSEFVCLLAGCRKLYSGDLHKIRWKVVTWDEEDITGLWC